MQFTDSLSENLEVLRELLSGVPPAARSRAKRAAMQIEKCWDQLRQDNPKDPATALGAAFAIYAIANRLNEPQGETESQGNLIKLLS